MSKIEKSKWLNLIESAIKNALTVQKVIEVLYT